MFATLQRRVVAIANSLASHMAAESVDVADLTRNHSFFFPRDCNRRSALAGEATCHAIRLFAVTFAISTYTM